MSKEDFLFNFPEYIIKLQVDHNGLYSFFFPFLYKLYAHVNVSELLRDNSYTVIEHLHP